MISRIIKSENWEPEMNNESNATVINVDTINALLLTVPRPLLTNATVVNGDATDAL